MLYIQKILPALINGAGGTLKIFALTLVFSIPLGLPIAMSAMSKSGFLRLLSTLYIWLFRGTPLLLQIYFFYFGLPIFFNLRMDGFTAAVLTFVLNYAAYFAEIYRGGIKSIHRGQFEACFSLGYTKAQAMRYVILPQVIQRIIPPVSNEVITLVKDTALVAAISVPELLKSAKDAVNRDVNPAAYAVAAGIYLIIILVMTIVSKKVEARFSRHERPDAIDS